MGSGFTGASNVAFIDDADGRNVEAVFKVESDSSINVKMPKLSDRTARASILVLTPGGVTVTLPHEAIVVRDQVGFGRGVTESWKAYVVQGGGIISGIEGRPAYVQSRGSVVVGPRSGTTLFLKNQSSGLIRHGPNNTIYHEPLANFGVYKEGDGANCISVSAIRPSFVNALIIYKNILINDK